MSKPVFIIAELTGAQGEPVRVRLEDAEARRLLVRCAREFGWHLSDDPLAGSFLKSVVAGLEIAEKIEGGA